MKKIRNFHAGWICEASGEGSGAGEVGYQEPRNTPGRNAWHGTADVSVVGCRYTNAEAGFGEKGLPLLVDAPAAHLTVRKGPFGRRPLTTSDRKPRVVQPHNQADSVPSRAVCEILSCCPRVAPRSYLGPCGGTPKRGAVQRGSRQSGSSRFPRAMPQAREITVAVTEGDTLKPTIDAGCAIRAGNGMTRERSAGRATTTLEQHAPPVREPQRVQWHPRRRLERRRPGPARACVPSRVRIRAPGASRLDQVRRAAERRVQPTVSRRAATITPPSARPTARPPSMSRSC